MAGLCRETAEKASSIICSEIAVQPLGLQRPAAFKVEADMKVRNSIRALAKRDRNNRVVRRRGRLYVINKKNPKMKVRQG